MNASKTALIALACIGTLSTGLLMVGYGPATGAGPALGADTAQSTDLLSAPSVLVSDSQGDARDHSIAYFNSGSQCRFGCGYPPSIAGTDPLGFPGSLPAPWMDIIEAGFLGETSSTIQLRLRTNTLTEGFPELSPAPGVLRGVDYITCFGSEGGERCVTLQVVGQTTEPMIGATFHIFSPVCGGAIYNDIYNDRNAQRPTLAPFQQVSECAFEIPAKVTYGTPGSIVFDVPKTFAQLDGAPSQWTHVRANVTHFWLQPGTVAHSSWSIDTEALPHHHDHLGPVYPSGVADELATTPADIRFTPTASDPEPVNGPVANPPRGLFFGDSLPKDPIFDLLATSIREEGDDVVVTQTFAGIKRVDAPDFEHMSLARVENGPLFEFGAFHVGGDWHAYVGTCIHFHCVDSTYVKLPLEITDGAPGTMEFRVPREYFGNPAAGTHLTFLLTTTQEVYPSYYAENGHENVHTMSNVDLHLGALPYTFLGDPVDRETKQHSHG